MAKKIGDTINCLVVTDDLGRIKISNAKPDKDAVVSKAKFEIIWIDQSDRQYIVAIDPNMIGWNLSEWHVMYWGIDRKHLKNKYFLVPME